MDKKFHLIKKHLELPEEQIQKLVDSGMFYRENHRKNGIGTDRLYVNNQMMDIPEYHILYTGLESIHYGFFFDQPLADARKTVADYQKFEYEKCDAITKAAKTFYDIAGWIKCGWNARDLTEICCKSWENRDEWELSSVCKKYRQHIFLDGSSKNDLEQVWLYRGQEYTVHSTDVQQLVFEEFKNIPDNYFCKEDSAFHRATLKYHRMKRHEIDIML